MPDRWVLEVVLLSSKKGAGGKQAAAELKGFEGAVKSAASAAKTLAIGGGAVVAAIAGAVKIVDAAISPLIEYGQTVRELGGALGLSAQETSRLIQVGDDFKISVDEMRTAMEMATKKGFVPSVENLAKLADKLEGIESPTERAGELTKIFGRNWTVLLPMLSAGGDAIRENAAAISDSLILTEESVQMTRDWEIALDQWQDRIEAAKISIGSFLVEGLLPWFDIAEQMPAVTDVLSNRLAEFDIRAHGAGRSAEETAIALARVTAEGIVLAGTAAPPLGPWVTQLEGVAGAGQAAADAQLALVQSFSEVTMASIAATGLEELNAALEGGLITPEQYEEAMRDLGGTLLGLKDDQLDAIVSQARFKTTTQNTTDAVWKEIAALKALAAQLAAGFPHTESQLDAIGQHGLNMTVPPGFDQDNFMIGVSSGERVKVTPAGRSAPPEAAAGGNSIVFNTQVSSDIQGMALLEKMRDAVRGVF
jgi:hypothetical protein